MIVSKSKTRKAAPTFGWTGLTPNPKYVKSKHKKVHFESRKAKRKMQKASRKANRK